MSKLDSKLISDLLEHPEQLLVKDSGVSLAWLGVCASLFETGTVLFTLASKLQPSLTPLNTLYTEGFDLEGVWNQLELLNTPGMKSIGEWVESFELGSDIESQSQVESGDKLEEESEIGSELMDEEEIEEMYEMEEEVDMPSDEDNTFNDNNPKRKRSQVDDDFFSLEDMEKFADLGEAKDIKKSKTGMDNGEESEDDDDEEMFSMGNGQYEDTLGDDMEEDNANGNLQLIQDIRYEDFFDRTEEEKPRRKNWKDEMDDIETTSIVPELVQEDAEPSEEMKSASNLFDQDEQEKDDTYLSTFEKSQIRLKKTIKNLEQENIGEKKWAMKGEVSSKARPMNSLLEEDLEIEQASKPAPVIDEVSTQTLDEMIIQRIKDEAWDDVVRKAPPKDTQFDPNRRFEMNDEKSKKSLAQIYEEDYQRQAAIKAPSTEKDLALKKQHDEIDGLFTNLCTQLDALSNYHYAPKDATLELTIIPLANVPAISLEDVTPANVSEAMLAAPKEVYDGKIAKSQAEMDSADKKKARLRAKKLIANEKKERERAKKLIEKESGTQAQMTQQNAVKKLMTQSNVTIIAKDGKDKKALQKGNNGKARVIEKGGKVKQERVASRPEMLRL